MTEPDPRALVRSRGRETRRAIGGSDRTESEAHLLHHLRSLLKVRRPRSDGGGTIGLFVAHDGEPDIMGLVPWLRDRGVSVALPVVGDEHDSRAMDFVAWRADQTLVDGRYGILAPPPGPAVDPDVTLVSCVAFDARGNRIGRGAGYFDRYLAARDTTIVGVAFERQRVDHISPEPHDVAMTTMVTDLGVRFIEWGGRG